MTGGVAVLCRPALVSGFALGGVETVPAGDPAAARARLDELRGRADIGLVLVEEGLLEEDMEEGFAGREGLPVVVPFPGPLWEAPPEAGDRVLEILRRAVGYRVRLG